MYKCSICGFTQEEAGEHCGQPMVKESEGAPEASAPSGPSEDSEGGQQM